MTKQAELALNLMRFAPALLLIGVITGFAAIAPGFLDARNFANILVQSSSLAIVAIGMTFVLVMAGIDLSVGSIMFLSAAVAGKLALAGNPLWMAIVAVLAVGASAGVVNGVLVTVFRIPAFIATLGILYAGRGLALYITQTRAMNLPEELLRMFTSSISFVPFPICVLAAVTAVSELLLSHTPWGLRVYAAGQSRGHAMLAGIAAGRITFAVYVLSGVLAALGGLVAVAQLGAVSPTFGNQRELAAIAAAVLGGTSLFGGRGRVFPGTIFGAVMVQTVESGLVIVNADPYLYPMVMAAIIFAAVLLDSIRTRYTVTLGRRTIRAHTAVQ